MQKNPQKPKTKPKEICCASLQKKKKKKAFYVLKQIMGSSSEVDDLPE